MQVCYTCHLSGGSCPDSKAVRIILRVVQPAHLSVAESKVLNRNLVNGVPSSKENKDPRVLPWIARYGSRALTGHTTDSVRPKHRLMPMRKGSILDCLIVSQTVVGLDLLSTATSSMDRCTELSKASWLGTVISPTLRNPKKAVQQAAHSMIDW